MLTCGNRSLSCSVCSSRCCSYKAATELHSWSWCIRLGRALISRTTTGHTGLSNTTTTMWCIWGGKKRKQTGLRWRGETLAVDWGARVGQWAWTTITELVEPWDYKFALLDVTQNSFKFLEPLHVILLGLKKLEAGVVFTSELYNLNKLFTILFGGAEITFLTFKWKRKSMIHVCGYV